MNERRIVEQALLVSMLIKVTDNGVIQFADQHMIDAARELHIVAAQVLAQAPSTLKDKLIRRIRTHGKRCITPHVTVTAQIPILGIAAIAIIDHLDYENYLIIGESSRLSTALSVLLPNLQPIADVGDNYDKGRAMAAAIFNSLQREGLFTSVRSLNADAS